MIRRIFIAFIAVVFLAGAAAAQTKKDRDAAKKLIEQADKAYSAKNYREAADKYGQALALVMTNASGHFRKGLSHYQLGENEPAISELTTALTQGYKPSLEVYKVRYYLYGKTKNYDAALADINSVLAVEPKNAVMLKAAGEINLERGNYSASLPFLERALAADPKDGDAYYYVARARSGMGEVKAQVDAGEKAISNGTRMVGETYFLLGDGYQRSRNVDGAIAAYQKAISAKPDNYRAYRSLSEVFRSENRFDEAAATTKEGLKRFPNDADMYTDLSWYLSLGGKPDEAIAAAKSAITLQPNGSLGYTDLCRAYNDAKSYDLAIAACNNALRLKPNDGETYFYLARSYDLKSAERSTEAPKYYRLAIPGLVEYTSKNPAYSDGWYLLGNAYFADSQWEKAIAAYRKCLELSPRYSKARYNLGITYLRTKNRTGALEQYNSLLVIDKTLAALLKTELEKK
jgi:protein O-GlcNAc transferase